MLKYYRPRPQVCKVPCSTIGKTAPRDTASDSRSRFIMLLRDSLSLSRGVFYTRCYLQQCLMGISVILALALLVQVHWPWTIIVNSDVNSTLPEPFYGCLESFSNAIRSRSFERSDQALASAERDDPLIAVVRISRNLSMSPSYRLLWKAEASGNDDFRIDIDIVTVNPDIRFYIQRTILESFNVSTTSRTRLLRPRSQPQPFNMLFLRGKSASRYSDNIRPPTGTSPVIDRE